jgi:hypothetical protein
MWAFARHLCLSPLHAHNETLPQRLFMCEPRGFAGRFAGGAQQRVLYSVHQAAQSLLLIPFLAAPSRVGPTKKIGQIFRATRISPMHIVLFT